MKSINTIIAEINNKAKQNIINAIWDRVDIINTLLDAAYSDGACGDYGYALRKAGDAVNAYMELVAICKDTSEQPLRENLRDALGSVNWEKFELPAGMMAAIKKARNEAANPGFNVTVTRMPCPSYISNYFHRDNTNANKDYDGFEEWEKQLIGKVELPKQGETKMFEYTVSYYEIVDGKLYAVESYNGTNRKEAAKFIKIANEDLGGYIDIRPLWKKETRNERLHRIWGEKRKAEREVLLKV